MQNQPAVMETGWIDSLTFFIYCSEQNNIYFNTAFSFFNGLLHEEKSGASGFIERLNVFSPDDFFKLYEAILLLTHKDLELGEKEAIIIVAVLHYICHAFLDEAELAVLLDITGESEEAITDLRARFLHFAGVIINDLKPYYAKRERFMRTIRWLETNDL